MKQISIRKNILLFMLIVVAIFVVVGREAHAVTFSSYEVGDNSSNPNFNEISLQSTVADVSLYDVKITNQEGNKIFLSFDVTNGQYIQPDIQYLVKLVKLQGENQIKVDEKIYFEKITLYENQTIEKEIEYLAPEYLSGDFQLLIISENSEGLPLSIISAGQISLTGNNQYVEIIPESCRLRVEGEAENAHYLMRQGVAVTNEENIIVDCELWNHFNESQTFIFQTETYRRTLSGDKVETKLEVNDNLSLNSQERKRFQFILPKPQDPQSYSVKLKLVNTMKQTISNEVDAHYVIQGKSATIQNVSLDKSYYKKDEMAKLILFITGPADMFPDSRLEATEIFTMPIYISIKSSNGEICSEFPSDLESNNARSEFEILMMTECLDPEVTIVVKDAERNTLAEKTHTLVSQIDASQRLSEESIEVEGDKTNQFFLISLLGISLTVIILLILIFLMIRNLRTNK